MARSASARRLVTRAAGSVAERGMDRPSSPAPRDPVSSRSTRRVRRAKERSSDWRRRTAFTATEVPAEVVARCAIEGSRDPSVDIASAARAAGPAANAESRLAAEAGDERVGQAALVKPASGRRGSGRRLVRSSPFPMPSSGNAAIPASRCSPTTVAPSPALSASWLPTLRRRIACPIAAGDDVASDEASDDGRAEDEAAADIVSDDTDGDDTDDDKATEDTDDIVGNSDGTVDPAGNAARSGPDGAEDRSSWPTGAPAEASPGAAVERRITLPVAAEPGSGTANCCPLGRLAPWRLPCSTAGVAVGVVPATTVAFCAGRTARPAALDGARRSVVSTDVASAAPWRLADGLRRSWSLGTGLTGTGPKVLLPVSRFASDDDG